MRTRMLVLMTVVVVLAGADLMAQRAWTGTSGGSLGLGFSSRDTDWQVNQIESGDITIEPEGSNASADFTERSLAFETRLALPLVPYADIRFDSKLGFVSVDELEVLSPFAGIPGFADTFRYEDGAGLEFGFTTSVEIGKEVGSGNEIGGLIGLGFGFSFVGFDGGTESGGTDAALVTFEIPFLLGGYYEYKNAQDLFSMRVEAALDIGARGAVLGVQESADTDSGAAYELEPENQIALLLNFAIKFTPVTAGIGLELARATGVHLFVGFAF